MKPIHKKLLLVPFGLFVGCLLAGALLAGWRFFRPAPRLAGADDAAAIRRMLDEDPRAIYQFDADVSYCLKPNFVGERQNAPGHRHETNSLGCLGREEVSDDPEVRRVLVLGDSVTYGFKVPYEDCFGARIASLAKPDCQVLNASCSGWSTHQEVGYYDKHLAHIEWDLVVLVVCLNDSIKFDWVWDPQGHLTMQDAWPLKGLRLITDSRIAQGVSTPLLRRQFEKDPALVNLSTQDNSLMAAWDRDGWGEYLEELIGPFFSAAGPPRALVVVPTRQQMIAARAGGVPEIVFQPQDQLVEFCRRREIAVFDVARSVLLPDCRDDNAAFADETHFSSAGHGLIAEPIWEFIRGRLGSASAGRKSTGTARGGRSVKR